MHPSTHSYAQTALALTLVASLPIAVRAQNVPDGLVVDTLVGSGLSQPTDCAFLPDGRCLVTNTAGAVVLYADGDTAAIGTVPDVQTGGERGLLSIAVDPGFAQNGWIYVYYSSTQDAAMHLDRFTCTGDRDDATSTNLQFASASRHVLLDSLPDFAGNHNGGSARFGPDGMLHLTVGDDATACDAQDPSSQAGCLLRLDVSGRPAGGSTTAPPFADLDPGDNPLSGSGGFARLVIAHGLRNPFRMEIDPLTGNCYIGDVGQNAVEEFDEYVRPSSGPLPLVNFGWPWREGPQSYSGCGGSPPSGLVDPIASVPQTAGWASVMGGARYRNLGGVFDLGPAYEGNVFFHDFFAGEVRRLVPNGSGWTPAAPVPGQPNATDWATGFLQASSLRLGPDGALWFTQRTGALKRLRPVGPLDTVRVIAGDAQIATAGETFPAPLVVQVFDGDGDPLADAPVTFTAGSGATVSPSGPVTTDANGLAQVAVTATAVGGAITVTASAPGTTQDGVFSLFARRLEVTDSPGQIVVTIANASPAPNPQVPFLLMLSVPGVPPLPTVLGPICTDPFHPLTLVLEDSIGLFGSELGGSGLVGAPAANKTYVVPPGLLAGFVLTFQAVGIDPTLGWFVTDCETHTF